MNQSNCLIEECPEIPSELFKPLIRTNLDFSDLSKQRKHRNNLDIETEMITTLLFVFCVHKNHLRAIIKVTLQ